MTESYFTKPSTGCLFLHQSIWIDQDQYGLEGVMNCPRCDCYFEYPTERKVYPVYKK